MAILSPADHADIRRSPEVQAALRALADEIAKRATNMALAAVAADHMFETPEYGTDMTVGSDRARAHVWAMNAAALHAENKVAPLLSIVANDGAGGVGSGRTLVVES